MLEEIERYKMGIIGGGTRCKTLLAAIFSEASAETRPVVLGVADRDPQAAGLVSAREKGIYTTTDYRELFTIEEIDLLLELTPDDALRQAIQVAKPPGILVLDHYEAAAILDYFRIKARKNEILDKLRSTLAQHGQLAVELLESFYEFVIQIKTTADNDARTVREDLIRSQWYMSQILDGSAIPAFVIDQQHQVTHWNKACERLTGFSSQKMVGSDCQWQPFRSEKRPTMADLVLDGISEEELWRNYGTRWEKSALISGGYEVEEFFSHLGNGGTWLFFTAVPIRTPDGRVVGAIETMQDRTRQKQAEAERERKNKALALKVVELSDKEQAMSQIINGSTIPTFVIDKAHRISHWNKALERLTGCSAAEMVGTDRQWVPFYDQVRPSMADIILSGVEESQIRSLYGAKWRSSMLIDGAYEAEVFFPQLGEGGKWCWFTAAPIKNPDGEVVGAIETIWDKTEDRKAEREHEQHTKELATFCSVYATLSGSLSLEGRINTAIEELANIFLMDGVCIFISKPDGRFHLRYSHGYSDQLCFANRIAEPGSRVARVAEKGKPDVVEIEPNPREAELQLLQQEGFKSLIYIPILDKNKRAFGVVRAASHKRHLFGTNEIRALELIVNRIGVAIENSLLQQEVNRRANFQAKLIGSSNDGIVATDEQWNVVVFNPAAENIFGYTGAEVIGKINARSICPSAVTGPMETEFGFGKRRPDPQWRETIIIAKDGQEIPVRFSGSVLREKHKVMGFVVFFQDLREIKRLEKELLGAERLAAIGQTVAGMAHCIKNILHGLEGGSYLVNVGIDKNRPDKLKTGWQMVQRNIGRTSGLVQDLLSYSKERAPEPEPCQPNAIVKEVCELMQQVAREQEVTLVEQLAPDIGTGLLDGRSLHRCLLNLVSNAIDACRDDPVSDKQHRVTVVTNLEGAETICFQVRDNGSGMSDEVKAKLFASFFSTKGAKGTGLGLLVTYKLIEENRGTIAVDSQEGKGTTFTVRLPFKQVPEISGQANAR